MGKVKKFFQSEFRKEMFLLEHDGVYDFYISSLQRNRSAVPLLCIRTIVFAGCVGILLASTIMTANSMSFAYWPIFLTHWGLFFITIMSGCACVVSIKTIIGRPDDILTLPWYIKTYWVLYNLTVPISFFISAFYWALLTQTDDEFSIDPVLDVFIHAVNAILMLVLLLCSRHPSRLLHFYHPLAATIIYLIFSIIYYYAGGTNPFGEVYIYPMLDWSYPGQAVVTVILSAALLIFMHLVVVAISVGRDALTKRHCAGSNKLDITYEAYN